MSAQEKQIQKKLRILGGTTMRSYKDYQSYVTEEQTEKDRLQKMLDENAEDARVKQQRSVVEETSTMIPFTRQKLQKAAKDLKKYLQENVPSEVVDGQEEESHSAAVRELEEYKDAMATLAQIEEDKLL